MQCDVDSVALIIRNEHSLQQTKLHFL